MSIAWVVTNIPDVINSETGGHSSGDYRLYRPRDIGPPRGEVIKKYVAMNGDIYDMGDNVEFLNGMNGRKEAGEVVGKYDDGRLQVCVVLADDHTVEVAVPVDVVVRGAAASARIIRSTCPTRNRSRLHCH